MMSRNIRRIPFSAPILGRRECRAVTKVLRSGWLTTGGENKLFEEAFAARCEVEHALSVNSATSGLHLLLEALGIGVNDYVITTPYTFTASAEILRYLGAHPLFADINEETGNLDPLSVEALLIENEAAGKAKISIKAILPVHLAGLPCDMDALGDLAEKYNLALVEDCAHAFPVKHSYRGKRIWTGTAGDGGAFSFYANKTMTTGEGGMVITNRKDLERRMSLMRLHGIDRDVWNRYAKGAGHLSWQYDIKAPGFKYNMTNFQAALGRVQLSRAFKLKEERTRQALFYNKAFSDLSVLTTPAAGEDHAWHIYMLRLDLDKLAVDRDEFIRLLYERGVNCSVHYRPLHMMSYYKKTYGYRDEDFPRAASLFHKSLSLPLYPGLSRSMQNRVIKAVRDVVGETEK